MYPPNSYSSFRCIVDINIVRGYVFYLLKRSICVLFFFFRDIDILNNFKENSTDLAFLYLSV